MTSPESFLKKGLQGVRLPPAAIPVDAWRGRLGSVCALAMILGAADDPKTAGKLSVLARVRSTTCYVGQTVDLFVAVIAGRESPTIVFPDLPGAAIRKAGTTVQPLRLSGIGGTVSEESMYRVHYRLVARRSGLLTIPPFSVRVGDRQGASAPIRLTVKKPPEAGRPSEFLGGVGPFEVEAAAVPDSVRTGQDFEYRVTVTGPAARGVASRPDLARLQRVPLGFQIENRPDVVVDDPPSHSFVYRVRPTLAGEATLPPVRVAAFEPATSRYQTRASEGVRVRVSNVPRFDPTTLDYGANLDLPPSSRGRSFPPASWVFASSWIVGCLVILIVLERRRTRASRRLRRLWRKVAAGLGRASSDEGRAQVITEGLTSYLAETLDRPLGALTPADAHEGIRRATGSAALARRAEELIARCDAARFDLIGAPAGDRLADGRWFFEALKGIAARARESEAGKHDERQSTA